MAFLRPIPSSTSMSDLPSCSKGLLSPSPLENHHLNGSKEKIAFVENATNEFKSEDEDDDDAGVDIDALIDDLESDDGQPEECASSNDPFDPLAMSSDLFQTDRRNGLADNEVLARRKKFGPNRMKEQKPNHLKQALSFFVGPIQFVMEVKLRSPEIYQ